MAKLTSKSAKKTAQATKKATNGSATKNGKKAKIVDLDDDVTDQEDDEQMSDEEATTNKNGGEHEHAASSSSSSSLLADCEKYFGSRDLYSILNLNKAKANESEIKKAYYKLSLKYHPDKAEETRRDESTIKFQVLSKIYSILSDAEKKKLYDEQGVVDDESGELEAKDWTEYWRTLFKKVTKADFDKFFVDYRNSDEERADLLRLYEKHEGDMGEILDEMFSQDRVADEPRFRQIIEEAIDAGKAKSHKKFTGESKQKAARRKAAYEREAIEAQEEMVKQGIDESEESLKNAILARRQMKNDDFLAKLEKKYAGKSSAGKKKGASKREDQEPSEEEDNDEEAYEVKPKKARGVSKASAVAAKKPAAKAGATKKVKRL